LDFFPFGDSLLVKESIKISNIKIKGIREGLLINMSEGDWQELEKSLIDHIDEQGDFLKGAQITIETGNQILRAANLGHIRDMLSERGITLRAVLSNSPTTEIAAQNLGLATRLSKPPPERTTHPLNTILSGDEAVLVQRTLRSGHSLNYFGHVIVIGDVNPGAEIIAGGNVIVWGRLRGTVHAGAEGNEDAVVCALDLSPMQLRIAEQISIAPKQKKKTHPEMARLINKQVVAQPWNNKK
jgi:septum site-determining protein MinC